MDMYVPDGFRGDDVEDEEIETVAQEGFWKCKTCNWQLANVKFHVAGAEHNRTQNCAFRCLEWINEFQKHDSVNHPSHYTFGKYEVIDVLEDWFPTDPLLWQVGKYISRAGRKGSRAEDLLKAEFYLKRAIAKVKGGEDKP